MEILFAIGLLAIAGKTLQDMSFGFLRAIGAIFMLGLLMAWIS